MATSVGRMFDAAVVDEPGEGLMTGDSTRAAWLRQARSYLRDADPVLARLIFEPAEPPAADQHRSS